MPPVSNLSVQDVDIEIDAIEVVDRLRLIDRQKVGAMAASITEIGLEHAISVALGEGNRFILIDGEHRLEAFRVLGRATIPARVREATPEEREKRQIHANFIRNDLGALDRIRFVGRLAQIFETEKADTQHGGDRKSAGWKAAHRFDNLATWASFSKEAASRTGLSERSIRRTRELFEHISDEVYELIHGSPLAGNQSQLRALAELDADQQVAVAKAVAAGAKSLHAAKVVAGLALEGGAVREEDRPLARLEATILRLSKQQLLDLKRMVEARLATIEATTKPRSKSEKKDAA